MKIYLSAALLLALGGSLLGQTFEDALRYSYTAPFGTARFAGTGGALTPMGVDVTTLHTNPAGIGWNRYNLVEVTPGFTFTGTSAELAVRESGGASSESGVNLTLPSIGVILAGQTRSPRWRTLNFGVSVSRIAEFNQPLFFDGRSEGSVVDGFVDDLNDGLSNPYGANLAVELDVLLQDDQGFFSDFDFEENQGRTIRREGLIDRSGGMTEVAIGFGGNYDDKVLWGLSFGVPFFNFEEIYTYDEIDDTDQITGFESASYDQNLIQNGTGFNAKLGVIILPTEQLRVSLGLHTPTMWTIDEQYSTNFEYNFVENGTAQGGNALSPLLNDAYNLQTPWRFTAGLGALIAQKGFVSIDADYANYAGNTLSRDDFATVNEAANADIDDLLGGALSVRVGGEIKVEPLQLRLGVGYRQVPFAELVNDEDGGILTGSGGVGYSRGKFFADLAVQYETYSAFREAYQVFTVPGQTILFDRNRVSALLTIGFRGFSGGF
jgi:hypothetical protein